MMAQRASVRRSNKPHRMLNCMPDLVMICALSLPALRKTFLYLRHCRGLTSIQSANI